MCTSYFKVPIIEFRNWLTSILFILEERGKINENIGQARTNLKFKLRALEEKNEAKFESHYEDLENKLETDYNDLTGKLYKALYRVYSMNAKGLGHARP